MKPSAIHKLTLSAMLIALGILLPFLTGNIKIIGNMLLPMHLPVLLCGLICGKYYGGTVGAVLPVLRSLLIHMPKLYPTALAMAFELAAYGFLAGLLYEWFQKKNLLTVYLSLIPSMLAGRLIWGGAMATLSGLEGETFTLLLFWTNGFVNAVPGIILQLVLIPPLVLLFEKTQNKT